MIFVDSDELDIFNCIYGFSEEKFGTLGVFAEGGLAFPYGVFLKEENDVRFFKCEKDNFENVGEIFPRHYIYDPSKRVEYAEWELSDDYLLRACAKPGEWVQHTSKVDSQYAMHEFVGGCWLVFEGAHFSKRIINEYTDGREKLAGSKVIQESGSRPCIDALSRKYLLEGALEVQPGPGWMLWYIYARSFHIEIPDVRSPPRLSPGNFFISP